jgi:hypothetical protein
MLPTARFGPSLLPVVVSAVTLIAFSGRPREGGGVSAHPRYRTVAEDSDLKLFVGVRVVASSPDALLSTVEALADWVKAARRDAAEAKQSGEWDVVHEIELVVGSDVLQMDAAEFAQYVHDLRYRELGTRDRRLAGSP